MPATTITRCAEPPVPSASGASLQSASTVCTKRRPIATRSSATCPAGGVRQRARRDGSQRPHRGHRVVGRGAQTRERVAREIGGGVEEVDAGVDRRARVVAEPTADVTHRVDGVADEREVGVAVVGVGVRSAVDTRGLAGGREPQRGLEVALLTSPVTMRSRRASSAGTRCTSLVRSCGTEELHRVDVAVADAQPEVEHASPSWSPSEGRRCRRWCRARRPAPPPGPSRTDDHGEERVRRAQAAGMRDGDVQRAGDDCPRS